MTKISDRCFQSTRYHIVEYIIINNRCIANTVKTGSQRPQRFCLQTAMITPQTHYSLFMIEYQHLNVKTCWNTTFM